MSLKKVSIKKKLGAILSSRINFPFKTTKDVGEDLPYLSPNQIWHKGILF